MSGEVDGVGRWRRFGRCALSLPSVPTQCYGPGRWGLNLLRRRDERTRLLTRDALGSRRVRTCTCEL